GAMNLFAERPTLATGQKGTVPWKSHSSIHDRMMITNARLWSIVSIRPRVAPGVRQLQSHEVPSVRTPRPSMFFDQDLAQARQSLSRVLRNHELIRIRAPLVGNSNRFSAPD